MHAVGVVRLCRCDFDKAQFIFKINFDSLKCNGMDAKFVLKIFTVLFDNAEFLSLLES